jgi:hypothetical protein
MLCLRKDYFLQASRLVTRLRESKIARLERELSNQKFGDTEAHDESLRQELSDMKEQVEYLNYQITHHPEILRFAIENLEQRGSLVLALELKLNLNLSYSNLS